MKEILSIIDKIEIERGFISEVIDSQFTISIIRYNERFLGEINWCYDILALRNDFERLNDIAEKYQIGIFCIHDSSNFPRKFRNPSGIISLTLSPQEIKEFKYLKNDFFNCIEKSSNGELYELKKNSLLEKYKQQIKLIEEY